MQFSSFPMESLPARSFFCPRCGDAAGRLAGSSAKVRRHGIGYGAPWQFIGNMRATRRAGGVNRSDASLDRRLGEAGGAESWPPDPFRGARWQILIEHAAVLLKGWSFRLVRSR